MQSRSFGHFPVKFLAELSKKKNSSNILTRHVQEISLAFLFQIFAICKELFPTPRVQTKECAFLSEMTK
jgi:regulator of replication initiation timing